MNTTQLTQGPDEDTCSEANFNFYQPWNYIGVITVILCALYVFQDFIRHKEKRAVPAKLMVSRAVVDFIWALLFFYMINDVHCHTSHLQDVCNILGVAFAFLFLLSIMYFSGICWDMYFTLNNPFRTPASDSWQIHFVSIVAALIFSFIVYLINGYYYRMDYQICLTKNSGSELNYNNAIVIYIPLFLVIIGGLSVTVWAFKRLKQRMLEETFELRWSVIRRQISIVSVFTINYFIAGCLWLPIALSTFDTSDQDAKNNNYGSKPSNQPYLLSAYIVSTIFFDLIAWIAKDSFSTLNFFQTIRIIPSSVYNESIKKPIIQKTSFSHHTHTHTNTSNDKTEPLLLNTSNNSYVSSLSNKSKLSYNNKSKMDALNKNNKKKSNNLSNALRKEVIAFILHGLTKSVKNTAKETLQTSSNSNFNDVWDADFDAYHSFNQHRKSAKSKSKSRSNNMRPLNSKRNKTNLEIHSSNSKISELSDFSAKRHKKLKDFDEDDEDEIDYIDDEEDEESLSSQSRSRSNSPHSRTQIDEDIADDEDEMLNVKETEPQKVYYPDSIRRNPAEHRGAMNRYNVSIDDDEDEDDNINKSAVPVPFTDFAPHVFRYLRTEIYGISDREYLHSIAPHNDDIADDNDIADICAKFSEGRSGAFFFYSRDGKYIIKTLTSDEAQLLIQILPKYLNYFKSEPGSYINKFFGLHSIKLYSLVIHFVVIENVFPTNSEPQEKYDIKGSWIARHTNHHIDEGKLMKDEDLHKQLLLDKLKSSEMYYQLFRDSGFLESLYIMDYSLLLGIYYMAIDPKKIDRDAEMSGAREKKHDGDGDGDSDDDDDGDNDGSVVIGRSRNQLHAHFYRSRAQTYHTVMKNVGDSNKAVKAKMIEGPGIYYIGIIDILQKWNTSKRLERYFKIYAKCTDGKGISCVEPSFYRRRFLDKMETIGFVPNQRK